MAISNPHQILSNGSPRENFACRLFDELWALYRQQVPYVIAYEEMIEEAGATFFNDHIAFRSVATEPPYGGDAHLARLFVALGYRATGLYSFEDKRLDAQHLQHPNERFPKIFLSQLRSWELPAKIRQILRGHNSPSLDIETLAEVAALPSEPQAARDNPPDSGELLRRVLRLFAPPVAPLDESELLAVNEVSQYAAWVLLHGTRVNHFTSLINSHNVASLDTIDKTVEAMRSRGIPMKSSIEGAAGSKLRQSATEAVEVEVSVVRDGVVGTRKWTYAYFELAERGLIAMPDGVKRRFEGFLGAQATELFEMTNRSPGTPESTP